MSRRPAWFLKTRELLVRQRSQTASAMRAHMAELGIIAATGMTSIAKLIAILRGGEDERLPVQAQAALLEMAEQIEILTVRVESLDKKIVAAVKPDDKARRLTTIPGVGPIIAATVRSLLAAREYDADRIRPFDYDRGAWGNIPPKRNRKDPIYFSPYLYRARKVERFFNRIKQCRRIATRYEKLAANYLAFIKARSDSDLATRFMNARSSTPAVYEASEACSPATKHTAVAPYWEFHCSATTRAKLEIT
jgi:transposase